MGERLGLAEVVQSLRAELYEAMVAGAGQVVRFRVGAVDLEFQVEVSREGGIGGKIRFWVVEAGGEGKVKSASTQAVKLRLEPMDVVADGPPLIGDAVTERPQLPRESDGKPEALGAEIRQG
jgi:Trypsin-co-occurring domain 2